MSLLGSLLKKANSSTKAAPAIPSVIPSVIPSLVSAKHDSLKPTAPTLVSPGCVADKLVAFFVVWIVSIADGRVIY